MKIKNSYLFQEDFSVLSEDTIVNIKIDKYFAIGQSIGVKYDDEFLNIDWKIEKKFQILSDADEKLLSFNDVSSSFDYNTKLY